MLTQHTGHSAKECLSGALSLPQRQKTMPCLQRQSTAPITAACRMENRECSHNVGAAACRVDSRECSHNVGVAPLEDVSLGHILCLNEVHGEDALWPI